MKYAKDQPGTLQTGIDGLRLIADRTGRYAGSDDPEYGPTEPYELSEHVDAVLAPTWARVTVWKLLDGARYPFSAVARFTEYAPHGSEKRTRMWRQMPFLMLGKVAEALALRKAFPAELSGIYGDEEMMQAMRPESVVSASDGAGLSAPSSPSSLGPGQVRRLPAGPPSGGASAGSTAGSGSGSSAARGRSPRSEPVPLVHAGSVLQRAHDAYGMTSAQVREILGEVWIQDYNGRWPEAWQVLESVAAARRGGPIDAALVHPSGVVTARDPCGSQAQAQAQAQAQVEDDLTDMGPPCYRCGRRDLDNGYDSSGRPVCVDHMGE